MPRLEYDLIIFNFFSDYRVVIVRVIVLVCIYICIFHRSALTTEPILMTEMSIDL